MAAPEPTYDTLEELASALGFTPEQIAQAKAEAQQALRNGEIATDDPKTEGHTDA